MFEIFSKVLKSKNTEKLNCLKIQILKNTFLAWPAGRPIRAENKWGVWGGFVPQQPFIPKISKNPFFGKIDYNIFKKCRFDENPKSQMPEGTLNRTFCLSKINFSSFFGIFWHVLPKMVIFLPKIVIFLPFWHFLAKKYPKMRFHRNFWKKMSQNTIL